MDKSHITKIITAVVLAVLVLPFSAAAVELVAIPDVSFDEDTTYTGLDLDDYLDAAPVGTVSYAFAGNVKIAVSIDANNIVTFTPNADWNGMEQITFTPTDDAGAGQVPDIIDVTVNAVNDAPTLTLAKSYNAVEDTAFSHQVVADDVDNNPLTFSADAGNWDAFSISNSGLISFTPTNVDVGIHKVTVTVNDGTVDVTKTTVFVVGEPEDDGSLLIEDIEVEDLTDDDGETLPGDELEVKFDVSNELTKDMNDIKVRVWIEDDSGDRISDRVTLDKFDVQGKDTESQEAQLRVPVDADKGTHYIVFEATGEDEDGNDVYELAFTDVDVERNSHDLLIDTVTFNPETPVCGGPVEVSVKVVNIGTSNEDDVSLTIKNTKLGIDYKSDVFEVDDSGSDADYTIRTVFDIPKASSDEFYTLDMKATFNGDSDTETSLVDMQVSCEGPTADEVELNTASTFADVARGQTVKFVVEVINNGASAADFTLSATGVQDWATVAIEPGDISLDSDATVPINFYVTPKSGASLGTHTATLTVMSGDDVVATKDFTVNVKSNTPTVSNLIGGVNFSDSDTTSFLLILVGIIIVAGFAMMSRSGKGVRVYDDVPRRRR